MAPGTNSALMPDPDSVPDQVFKPETIPLSVLSSSPPSSSTMVSLPTDNDENDYNKKVALGGDIEVVSASSSTGPVDENETLSPKDLTGSVSYLTDLEDLPQGRHLGLFSTIVLFVSRILGTGIFSISSGIYEDCGRSAFWFFAAWLVAAVLAFCGLYVFLELGSLVPRSGGMKVFLEFIYDRPKLMVTVSYSIFSVMFGFTLSNSLIFGEYLLRSLGIDASEIKTRWTGLIFLYITALIHGVSVHHGVKVQNIIGSLKLVLMLVMVLTGIYVIFFPQSITNIESHLKWDEFFLVRTEVSSSSFASAVIKATFAFAGWNSVHTISSEVKDPVRVFKIAGPTSLIIASITYIFTNFAYLIVISSDEFADSKTVVGSLLFERIFGVTIGRKFLTFAIALCAGGNVFVVMYTMSRVSQEAFREGFLPFSKTMSSNWPFGAPLATLILSVSLSTLVVVAAPSGDIYGYIISIEGYPNQLFICACAVGVFILRRRYPEVTAPIRASVIGTVVTFLISLYLLLSPFISSKSPNPKGLETWPSCAVIGISCYLACVAYWYVTFELLPKIFGYNLISEDIQQDDGLTIKKWIKVYN